MRRDYGAAASHHRTTRETARPECGRSSPTNPTKARTVSRRMENGLVVARGCVLASFVERRPSFELPHRNGPGAELEDHVRAEEEHRVRREPKAERGGGLRHHPSRGIGGDDGPAERSGCSETTRRTFGHRMRHTHHRHTRRCLRWTRSAPRATPPRREGGVVLFDRENDSPTPRG